MRKLILMRHAKSDWSEPGQRDIDRTLARRGRLAAPLMAAYLSELGLPLDHVRISNSRRTQETWARMTPLLTDAPDAVIDESLYTERAEPVIASAAQAPDTASTCLIIGHNPALEAAAIALLGGERPASLSFATAAVGVFEFDGSWRDLGGEPAQLTSFEAPKTLV